MAEVELVDGVEFGFERRINRLHAVERAADGRRHGANSVRITAQIGA
jgi:hypothetical protein